MNDKTATFLSFLFHPMILPLVAMALMIGTDPLVSLLLTLKMKGMILSALFITTILVPLLLIYLIYHLGVIRSFHMRSREERAIPLLVIAVFYYLTYYLLKGLHLPQLFHMYMLGATFMIVLLITFNFFRKVSLHMAGLGAFTGLMTGIGFHGETNTSLFILAGILLSGVVGTARLKLNAHHPSDLYTGWLAGAIVMFLTGFLF
jgi:membrane-associated phospholipid phosphatase